MKKKNKSFGDVVAVGSALAGAALGAAAVMLSDKKNQEKIKKTIDGISHDAVVIGKKIKKKADEFAKKTEKSEKEIVMPVIKTTAKKVVPIVKKTVKKAVVKKITPEKK